MPLSPSLIASAGEGAEGESEGAASDRAAALMWWWWCWGVFFALAGVGRAGVGPLCARLAATRFAAWLG